MLEQVIKDGETMKDAGSISQLLAAFSSVHTEIDNEILALVGALIFEEFKKLEGAKNTLSMIETVDGKNAVTFVYMMQPIFALLSADKTTSRHISSALVSFKDYMVSLINDYMVSLIDD